jgi:hypothetical protein
MCIAQNIISLRSVGNCFAISSSATFEIYTIDHLKIVGVQSRTECRPWNVRAQGETSGIIIIALPGFMASQPRPITLGERHLIGWYFIKFLRTNRKI